MPLEGWNVNRLATAMEHGNASGFGARDVGTPSRNRYTELDLSPLFGLGARARLAAVSRTNGYLYLRDNWPALSARRPRALAGTFRGLAEPFLRVLNDLRHGVGIK